MGGALSSNVHEVFDRFDANHDGTIDESELATALRMIYNARTTSAVCRELIATADLNNDGVLERHEFVQFVSNFGDLLPARADEADDASELVRVAFSSSRPPGFKCRGALVSSATGDAEEAGVMAGMRVARVHARAVARDDDVNTIVDDHRAAMPVFTVSFLPAGGGDGGEGGAAALVTTELATDAGLSARATDGSGDGAGGQEDAEEVGDTAEGLTDIGEVGGDVDREETDLSTPFLLLSLAGAKLGINLKMSVEWKLVRVAWGWTRWLCAFAFSFPNTPDGFGAVLGIAGGLLLPVAVWLRLSFLNRQTENKWDHERKLVCCCERNKWGAASVGLWLLVLAGASSGAGGGESIWFAGFVGFVGVATAYHGLVMLARQHYYNVVRGTTTRTLWRETYWHGVVAVEGAAIFFMFLMSFTVRGHGRDGSPRSGEETEPPYPSLRSRSTWRSTSSSARSRTTRAARAGTPRARRSAARCSSSTSSCRSTSSTTSPRSSRRRSPRSSRSRRRSSSARKPRRGLGARPIRLAAMPLA